MNPGEFTLKSEAELLASVESALTLFGWRWQHCRPAQTARGWRTALSGHKGFPDLIAVRRGRLMIAELKSERGRLAEEQEAWIEDLRKCHAVSTLPSGVKVVPEVYVWRPSDWLKEEITRVLQ